jgi:hypothetical protein
MTYFTTSRLNFLLIFVTLFTANHALAGAPPSLPYNYPFGEPELARQLKMTPMVIELFTSLDCLFCPRAEHLIKDMAEQTSAITLACHTDPEGPDYPLARDFCSTRQASYAEHLTDGLQYTPQMVINGRIDATGHEFDDVARGLKVAIPNPLPILKIKPSEAAGVYALELPAIKIGGDGSGDIIMVTYRKPYTVPKTMRQSVTHTDPLVRVIRRLAPLGGYDGRARTMSVSYAPEDDEAGFVILIQGDDGTIAAAVDSNSIVTP